MKTTDVVGANCSTCGKPLDAASHDEAVPRAGDVSVCFYCGALHTFVALPGAAALRGPLPLTLRPCTLEELESEGACAEDLEELRTIRSAIARRRAN